VGDTQVDPDHAADRGQRLRLVLLSGQHDEPLTALANNPHRDQLTNRRPLPADSGLTAGDAGAEVLLWETEATVRFS
jgi:hypothetical protein